MSTDQTTTPVWGQTTPPDPTPGPAVKPNRLVTIVIAIIAAVVLVGGGVAVAMAVDSGSSGTTGQGGPGSGQFGGGGPGGFGRDGGAGNGLSGALHGDFVASDGNDGYVTKRLQSGTVTAVSSTSITAKSADGYSTTFVVNSSTSVDNGIDAIADVKTGDTVTIVGTVSASIATATTVFDTTLNQANNGNQMGNPPNQNGGPS